MQLRGLVYAKVGAEGKVWRQHGDVAKLPSENLLEAANTFADLLAARTGEAIGLKLEQKYRDVLPYPQERVKAGPLGEGGAHRGQAEMKGKAQLNAQLRGRPGPAAPNLNCPLGSDPAAGRAGA